MPDAYDRIRDARVSRVTGRAADSESDAYHLGLNHGKDGLPKSKNPYDKYVPGQRVLHQQYLNGHEKGSGMIKTEAKMTEPEMKKREEIVKSMKKNMGDFRKRYGERAKEVMYATATKQAMKEESEDLDEAKSLSKMSDAELSSAYKDNEAKIKSMPHVPMGHRLIQRRRAIKLQQMINTKKSSVKEEAE